MPNKTTANIIEKFIPKLSRNQAYKLIKLFIILLFVITLVCIGVWYFKDENHAQKADTQTTENNSYILTPLTEQITPPLIGELEVFNPGAIIVSVKSNGSMISYDAVPVESEFDEYIDFTVSFDITNTSLNDLRIDSIFIHVFEWRPLEEYSKYPTATARVDTLKYRCLIDKEIKEYPAVFEDIDKYVKLSHGELEYIEIEISALTEGFYKFEVILEYSLAGRVNRVTVGQVGPILFLYNIGLLDDMPGGIE